MIKKTLFPFIYFLLSAVLLSAANTDYSSKMIHDLDLIRTIFEVKYAPAEWKKSYAGWDLGVAIESAKDKVLTSPLISMREYQKLLLDFFNSTQDYHVNITFYATELSFLPFRLEGAEGRYFIAWLTAEDSFSKVDLEYSAFLSHTKIGDEVISINGIPADQYVTDYRSENFSPGGNGTDQMMAEQFLTLRLASRGTQPQQGPLKITIKHRELDQTITYSLQWLYVPEEIKSSFSKFSKAKKPSLKNEKKRVALFDKAMITPLQDQLQKAQGSIKKRYQIALSENSEEDSTFMVLGQYKSFVPPLGDIIWKGNSSFFHAYIFQNPAGDTIGYVRIPTFSYGRDEYQDLERIISKFQNETDALIIDQLNNPGGYLNYLFTFLSMLSDKPLMIPPQRISITQEDVSNALDILEDPEYHLEPLLSGILGFSISSEDIPEVLEFYKAIISEWEEGHTFTRPLHYLGISSIRPNPRAHYTKPILILVNHLDFSCADFFPAILQDNQRAKVFGSKTAGAGGFVLQHQYPNLFGIRSFSFTGSIAYRSNDQPIENLGVTPDFLYELSPEDFLHKYDPYIQSINQSYQFWSK